MTRSPNKLIPSDFTPVPALGTACDVEAVADFDATLDAVALLVAPGTDLVDTVGLGEEALAAAGFDASPGSSLVVARDGHPVVLVGLGDVADLDADKLRDAAAAAARATAKKGGRIGVEVPELGLDAATVGQVLAEGALLARYRYSVLKAEAKEVPLELLELKVAGADAAAVTAGIAVAEITVRATLVARDLANTPPGHLTATDIAEVAAELGAEYGFEVESFDKAQLIEMGCGGILGVNAGSAEEPRLVVLTYTPAGEVTGHLGLVGKGIMYDSGGISLKPSDPMHLLMKMDMGGAAAVLGAFTALRDLGTTAAVSGWLTCTDNMPSGSAYKLGDVLTCRNGKTVEIKNTDAEGRIAMMDGLALAVEAGVDAIVDIATLTGAALMALGKSRAAVLGNDQGMVDRVTAAAKATDEPVWQLPLERKYRKQLDSDVADISNLGGPHAGATTAALFLDEFVAGTPWAHIDIAGTMATDADDAWRSAGATGFGARLLATLAADFRS
ncbi:MAG TPA: leucyl aminopeptidase family protein [Propionicimonas sp.]|uniref:leucyl aminopeptidase family protein n=1 Tax=Propionicimonas sp. TaxID=1955623 RepID=UPI002F42CADE